MIICEKEKFHTLARELAEAVYDRYFGDEIESWAFIMTMAMANRTCKTLTGLTVWWAIVDDNTAISIVFEDSEGNHTMQFSFDIEELED